MERGGLSPEASLPKVVRPASLQSGQKHSVIMNFRKIRTFWRMDPCKRRMALQAIILPPGVRWGVALLGVARTSALLSAWSSGRVYKSQEGEPSGVLRQAVRVQQVVKASLGVGGTCLVRSLVLQSQPTLESESASKVSFPKGMPGLSTSGHRSTNRPNRWQRTPYSTVRPLWISLRNS